MPDFMTKEQFDEERHVAVVNKVQENWTRAGQFVLDAIREDHAWADVYRAHPEYDLEADVELALWAVDREANIQRWHHLRRIRRFYFQRYAFCRACGINRRIHAGGQASLAWLYKDVLLLRGALALLLGYAVLFGSGSTSEVLIKFSSRCPWALPLAGVGMLFGLVFLNARDQAGRVRGLWKRALWATAGVAVWAAVMSLCAMGVFHVAGMQGWSGGAALAVSSVAAPLGILGQFFFGSRQSLADPL